MKKLLLSVASLAAAITSSYAQVYNNSFETWENVTIEFPGSPPILAGDTFLAEEPEQWSTSNAVSGAASLGGRFFVTKETTNVHIGSSAVRMITDTIRTPFGLITLPGFLLNGDFEIGLSSIVGSGDVISPAAVAGAGQPYNQRLASVNGFYHYTPVFNDSTGANDTCVIWATLRKGTTVVADAIFKTTVATQGNAYQAFTADFKYVSCEMPDTLVILMASSVPNVQTLLGGSSALKRGSVLLVDSLGYTELPVNFSFPPIARPDQDTTEPNVALVVNVVSNDEDCDDATNTLTVSVTVPAANGTTSVAGGNVTYTPNSGFAGVDSFFYTLSDGSQASDPTRVRLLVFNTVGINDLNEVAVTLFPVPANNTLNIQTEYNGNLVANVYNVVGSLVATTNISSSTGSISVSNMPNGMYALQLVNEAGQTVARSKFSVAK